MMKNPLVLLLAALPMAAVAHTNHSARLQIGVFQNHVTLGGAAGNLAGLSIGVKGMSRHLGGMGVRARLSYAAGNGASLETLAARIVAYPRQGISPYVSLGALDLSTLSGVTSVTTSYSINPMTGIISPTTTTTALPPIGMAMGYGFVGLRAHYRLNPHLVLTAHAALGAGVGDPPRASRQRRARATRWRPRWVWGCGTGSHGAWAQRWPTPASRSRSVARPSRAMEFRHGFRTYSVNPHPPSPRPSWAGHPISPRAAIPRDHIYKDLAHASRHPSQRPLSLQRHRLPQAPPPGRGRAGQGGGVLLQRGSITA